jgi:hypothetical protein
MSFVRGTLILTFSHGEKEYSVIATNELAQRSRLHLPLLQGEGWGEGHALKRFLAIKGWI